MNLGFTDRTQAGKLLAERLKHYAGLPDVVVLALPRGGIPVAKEIADALGAPLDIMPVRKLGVPGREELAMGALAAGGGVVFNEEVFRALDLNADEVKAALAAKRQELAAVESRLRAVLPAASPRGKVAILVDDGVATGSCMEAAIAAARSQQAKRIVLAIPVSSQSAARRLDRMVDEMVLLLSPPEFNAVGQWYENFSQLSDDDVMAIVRPPVAAS